MSSAIANRERRKTAGRRMTSLVGKALEEDDAFWGHDTWAEEADSGNESFHESDEDSELQKDEFDSDFNDSESDHDEEEKAAGRAEEAELLKAERKSKQRSSNYVDIAKAGRDLMKKKTGKGKKRLMGDGVNAGIVLNFPSAGPSAPPLALSAQPVRQPKRPASAIPDKRPTKRAADATTRANLARNRPRRSQHATPTPTMRNLRETRSTAPSEPLSKRSSNGKSSHPTKKMKRRRYAQEELLSEAVNQTEPENERWLLARKRIQDLAEKDKETLSLKDKVRGKVIQKYHSRRGCLITLTFPEMDAVPEILTRKSSVPAKPQRTHCVVTGKPSRYLDPLTQKGYYDVAAFKELRRRHRAGEPLDQRPKQGFQNSFVSKSDTEDGLFETRAAAGKVDKCIAADNMTSGRVDAQKPVKAGVVKNVKAGDQNVMTVAKRGLAKSNQLPSLPDVARYPAVGNGRSTNNPVSIIGSKDSPNQSVRDESRYKSPDAVESSRNAAATIPATINKDGSTLTKRIMESNSTQTEMSIPRGLKSGLSHEPKLSIKGTGSQTGIPARLDVTTGSSSNSFDGSDLAEANQDPGASGRRTSKRKWKPSSKLLQNIANEDSYAAAAAAALTIRSNAEEWQQTDEQCINEEKSSGIADYQTSSEKEVNRPIPVPSEMADKKASELETCNLRPLTTTHVQKDRSLVVETKVDAHNKDDRNATVGAVQLATGIISKPKSVKTTQPVQKDRSLVGRAKVDADNSGSSKATTGTVKVATVMASNPKIALKTTTPIEKDRNLVGKTKANAGTTGSKKATTGAVKAGTGMTSTPKTAKTTTSVQKDRKLVKKTKVDVDKTGTKKATSGAVKLAAGTTSKPKRAKKARPRQPSPTKRPLKSSSKASKSPSNVAHKSVVGVGKSKRTMHVKNDAGGSSSKSVVSKKAGHGHGSFPLPRAPTARPEPVYLIPREENGAESDNEPRYITQSELIMQAIEAYCKRKEEQQKKMS